MESGSHKRIAFLFSDICTMRSHSYLNSANRILETYDGSIPLASWLKTYFRENKKYGSRDRKEISNLCYCYFRLGHAYSNKEREERLLIALFLCSETPSLILSELKPEWNALVKLPLQKKLEEINGISEVENIFPFPDELSPQISLQSFSLSFLQQPDLFIRVRPGKKEILLQQLKNANLSFVEENDETLRFINQTKIEDIISVDEDAVIQDINSQKVILPLKDHLPVDQAMNVWDCCAASGGKSILIHDHYPQARLTVSDIRESIMINLQKRFKAAGITQYKSFIHDLSSANFHHKNKYELIICDAPCSGSGTWARTPEQLIYFKKEKIDSYAELQKKIVRNAIKQLKPGGFFLYITCSVFAKENEELVDSILKQSSLQLDSQQYFRGYEQKADTLFAAQFSL